MKWHWTTYLTVSMPGSSLTQKTGHVLCRDSSQGVFSISCASALIVLTEWGSVACFVRQSRFAPCVRNFPGSSQHESSRSGCQRAKAGGICIKKVLTASISQPETPVPHVSYASSNPTHAALSVWLIRACWLSLFRRVMICSPLAQQPDRCQEKKGKKTIWQQPNKQKEQAKLWQSSNLGCRNGVLWLKSACISHRSMILLSLVLSNVSLLVTDPTGHSQWFYDFSVTQTKCFSSPEKKERK